MKSMVSILRGAPEFGAHDGLAKVGRSPTGGKKPFDKPGAKDRPAKPKTDARDTSKRFVPPKVPKR
jgi:ATP-dependent RNA helicase DeaD